MICEDDNKSTFTWETYNSLPNKLVNDTIQFGLYDRKKPSIGYKVYTHPIKSVHAHANKIHKKTRNSVTTAVLQFQVTMKHSTRTTRK